MKIHRASHLGMCFGVRDAIQIARDESANGPVTVLGDLVHNETVLADLRQRGIRIEPKLDTVSTHTVMVTAHGTSDRTRGEIRSRGHRLIEATCPLVHFAHQRVLELAHAGYHPVIIGQRNHIEVRGLTGDLDAFDVILEDRDLEAIPHRARYGVAAQTTQPLARVRHLLRLVQERFPRSEVRFADTVCLPTRQRQRAAEELAASSNVVVVIGGSGSNNTRELVRTCQQSCARVHHIQSAADLRPEWFRASDTVGLTAGTSTPDILIDAAEGWLQRLASTLPAPRVQEPVTQPQLAFAHE